jgi:hypothetical protein
MREFARLPNLLGKRKYDAMRAVAALGRPLERLGEQAGIRFRIVGRRKTVDCSLLLRPRGHRVVSEELPAPDLEVIVRDDAWRAVISGTLSPLVALAEGRLRVRGNIDLGKRLLAGLCPSGSRIDPCERGPADA